MKNYKTQYHSDARRPTAFTLLELMVVLVILGLLAALVTTNVIDRIGKAKIVTTKAQTKTLHQAVLNYKLDTGQYPDSSVGLEALVTQPPDVANWSEDGYLEGVLAVPLDAWGNEYLYQYPGEFSRFDIFSYGADGEEGGEGEDADIYNSDVQGVTTEP